MFIRSGILILIFLSGSRLSAGEQEWLFDTPRIFGRGRTFVAARDSDAASRFNPATLGEADITFQWRLLEAEGVFISENTVNTFSDLASAATSNDAVSVLKKFDENFGKKQYFKGQGSVSGIRVGGFEISPFAVNTSFLEFSVPPLPEAEWSVDTIAGLSLSFGMEIFGGIYGGVTLRPVMTRSYIFGKIGFVDIVEFINPDQVKFEDYAAVLTGSGTGGDLGFVGQLTESIRWGLSIRNIGDTAFKTEANSGDQKIPPLRQIISLGFLHHSKLGSMFNLDQLLDFHSLTNRDGLNLLRLINYGVELGTTVFSRDHDYGVTFGLNEGYFSLGAFVDLFIARLELVNYGVENGHGPGQEQDRRWGVSLRSTMTF